MPRRFGGHTPLGNALNEAEWKQEGLRSTALKIKYGIIKEVVGRTSGQGVYNVILQIVNKDGSLGEITRPIPLMEHPSFLAANYGPPDELVQRYVCRVEYRGTSINRGFASIVRPLTSDKEITEQANQITMKGAAFAPPGGSFISGG